MSTTRALSQIAVAVFCIVQFVRYGQRCFDVGSSLLICAYLYAQIIINDDATSSPNEFEIVPHPNAKFHQSHHLFTKRYIKNIEKIDTHAETQFMYFVTK